MTPEKKRPYDEKKAQVLDEICENTRAIRRVSNRILDHLHEYHTGVSDYKDQYHGPDEFNWEDLDDNDDMYM